jgi:cytochrome c peroxidase
LPEKSFSDTNRLSRGIFGRKTERNTPSLLNMDAQPHFMWDGGVPTIAMQALVPLQDTNEMGNEIRELVERLSKDEMYNSLAQKAFGRNFDAYVLTQALEVFQKSLVSRNSAFDKWNRGEDSMAISLEAIKGFELFSSERLNCIACHKPPDFTDYSFANKGLYTTYPDAGRNRITYLDEDKGKFKVPSLRNVAITAPYMHDGRINTLEEVIQHYATGGENHPNKDERIQPFELSVEEEQQLISFLNSLIDTSYMSRFRSHN